MVAAIIRVNELLGAKSVTSNKKSNETIANEVIQGKTIVI